MHENVGLRTLQIAGVEPARTTTLPGSSEICGCKLLFEVTAEQSVVASSIHLLYVGLKRS